MECFRHAEKSGAGEMERTREGEEKYQGVERVGIGDRERGRGPTGSRCFYILPFPREGVVELQSAVDNSSSDASVSPCPGVKRLQGAASATESCRPYYPR